VPGWFTRVLLPEIQEMNGELKSINTRIGDTNSRIDDLKDYLKENLNVVQRLAVIEAKVRELEAEKK
jgi:hypothetical protein